MKYADPNQHRFHFVMELCFDDRLAARHFGFDAIRTDRKESLLATRLEQHTIFVVR